jgi:hypothetical protein
MFAYWNLKRNYSLPIALVYTSFISVSIFLALNTDMPMIESFTGFQPLREAWIGGTYPVHFYKHLEPQVYDTFAKITEQTERGFTNLEKVLHDLDVVVRKPKFTDDSDDYKDQFGNLIKPPVCPRDWAITVGQQLWIIPQGYRIEPYQHVIDEYITNGEHVEVLDRGNDDRAWLGFPGMVRLGKKIIVDTGYEMDDTKHEKHVLKAIEHLEGMGYEVQMTQEGGHMDAVFCPIQKGQIFASHWGEKYFYDKSLPGWQVFDIETQLNGNGKWWTEENNYYSPIFSRHIESKAAEWVGDASETVFEVNMLVVDEKNVICITEHEQSFRQMEKLGITPHVVDFPTRAFWDGGIHCVTLDIRRMGGCINYF